MKDLILFFVIVGLLCFWGYRNNIGENLSRIYAYRDSSDVVTKELFLMEAKLSKTVYKYLSGLYLNPFKNKYMAETPLDMTNIAKNIVKRCTSDDEKIRAIYKWITHNIEYDYDYRIYMPDECYEKRKGVCNAYASLMVKMLYCIGIPALKIEGRTKHPDGSDYGRHSWVMAERSNGDWLLCDPTWDTGGRNEKGKYTNPTWEWYDCPPEIMVYTHYPDERRFQLLENPLSKQEYEALPYVHPTDGTDKHKQVIRERKKRETLNFNN